MDFWRVFFKQSFSDMTKLYFIKRVQDENKSKKGLAEVYEVSLRVFIHVFFAPCNVLEPSS